MKPFCILLISLFVLQLQAQNQWRCYLPLSLDVGAHLPTIVSDSNSVWTSKISRDILIRGGASFLYKKKWGMLAEVGGVISSYEFLAGTDNYSISYLRLSTGLVPYYLIPFKGDDETNLHLGLGIGYTFNNHDELIKHKPNYTATATSYGPNAFTYSPEIGITRVEDKFGFSFLLSYCYQNISNNTVNIDLTGLKGHYNLQCKGDYLALKFRFNFRIGKDKIYPSIYKPTPPENELYTNRTNTVIKSFETHKDHVILQLYESSKVDHDSISVSVNGQYILVAHALTKEKVEIRIPLEKGYNTITIYAINEGDIPPNTATCFLKYGLKEAEFPIQTGHKKNASIEIFRK